MFSGPDMSLHNTSEWKEVEKDIIALHHCLLSAMPTPLRKHIIDPAEVRVNTAMPDVLQILVISEVPDPSVVSIPVS